MICCLAKYTKLCLNTCSPAMRQSRHLDGDDQALTLLCAQEDIAGLNLCEVAGLLLEGPVPRLAILINVDHAVLASRHHIAGLGTADGWALLGVLTVGRAGIMGVQRSR